LTTFFKLKKRGENVKKRDLNKKKRKKTFITSMTQRSIFGHTVFYVGTWDFKYCSSFTTALIQKKCSQIA